MLLLLLKEVEKMSIDLNKYGQMTMEGEITAIYIETLRDWLTKIKKYPISNEVAEDKFSRKNDKGELVCNLDKQHIIIVGVCDGAPIDGFFMVPKGVRGYEKSNLKKFIEKNDMPLIELPKGGKKWLGKKAEVKVDKNGFMRWAI